MLKTIVALLAIVSTAIGSTNYFIGYYQNPITGLMVFPYSIGTCSFNGTAWVKYTCNGVSSVTEDHYAVTDPTCSTATYTKVYNSSTTAGFPSSWDCSGENHYTKLALYVNNPTCASSPNAANSYATNVCSYTGAAGKYSKVYCNNMTGAATINYYTDATCSTLNASLPFSSTCNLFTIIPGGIYTLYGKLAYCDSSDNFTVILPSNMTNSTKASTPHPMTTPMLNSTKVNATTNYFIGTFTNPLTSAVLTYAYPVGQCVTNGVSTLKYECDGTMKIIETTYNDTACMMMSGQTNYTSSANDGSVGSWNCSGENYFGRFFGYFGAGCNGNPVATSSYAVDVCYESYDSTHYTKVLCDSNMKNIVIGYYTDSMCSENMMNQTASSMIQASCTQLSGSIYSKFSLCFDGHPVNGGMTTTGAGSMGTTHAGSSSFGVALKVNLMFMMVIIISVLSVIM